MKIGFDAKRLYNNFTGLGNYSRTLVGNLIKQYRADELYLYTPKRKLDPIEGATTRIPQKCRSTWRNWGIKRDLRKDQIQIYHGLSHELPFGIHRCGIKTVVTVHDVCYRTFPEMFPLTERMIYGIKYRYSCRHADRIIAISQSTRADIIKYMGVDPKKIEVIYQSINPIFYTPQASPREVVDQYGIPERYILYVGSINSRKNLLGIVQAYALLPAEHRLPLVVIGNGTDYREKVMRYAAQNDLTKHLVMLDSVNEMETLQAFYQCAECFVYPSFYEGFGLPVTEALLSRTPVITSHISSLPEAGGDAAIYIDPTKPEEIAAAISKILTEPDLANDMRTRGVEYALETFDPAKLTKQVHDLYEKIVRQ